MFCRKTLKGNKVEKNSKQLFIHIGMNKTGSSSIQESLQSNLNSKEWEYMKLGAPNHGGAMLLAFKEDFFKSKYNHNFPSEEEVEIRKKKILTKLTKRIVNSNKNKFIISGETILVLNEKELKNMKFFFEKYVSKIFIVSYVRRPKGFNESSMQQRLKFHGEVNLKNVIPHYKKTFKKFDDIFKKDCVFLWKFEPRKFSQKDVVVDFCQRLKIALKKEQTIRVNESLSKEAISLLYTYRKYLPQIENGEQKIKQNLFFIDLLRKVGSEKYKVSPKLIKPLLEEQASDIAWMEERLGESLDESFDESPTDINDEKDLEEFAIQSVHLILDMIDDKYLEKPIDKKSPQGVARIVHALRLTAGDGYNATIQNEQQVIAQKVSVSKTQKQKNKFKKLLDCIKSKIKR